MEAAAWEQLEGLLDAATDGQLTHEQQQRLLSYYKRLRIMQAKGRVGLVRGRLVAVSSGLPPK